MKCREETCAEEAFYAVHWPGEEIHSCPEHAAKWAGLAVHMGLKLCINVIGQPRITIHTPEAKQ